MVAAVLMVIAVGIVGVAEPALLGAVSAPLLPFFSPTICKDFVKLQKALIEINANRLSALFFFCVARS